MGESNFHNRLKMLMDELVNRIYDLSEKFPRSEIFGLTSQIRRAALSVILNYIEGYARQRKAVLKSFLEISYGSLKETGYLICFANKRRYMADKNKTELMLLVDEIGRMLWSIFSKL